MTKEKLPKGCKSVPQITYAPKDTRLTYEDIVSNIAPDDHTIQIAKLVDHMTKQFNKQLLEIVDLVQSVEPYPDTPIPEVFNKGKHTIGFTYYPTSDDAYCLNGATQTVGEL